MTLEIKEGRYYVNRLGEKRGPMTVCDVNRNYPWRDCEGATYAIGGQYVIGKERLHDLIAEWTDPAEEAEWGEWVDSVEPNDIVAGRDYQFQRIGGVCQYRIRNRQTVTMLVDVIDGKPDLSTLRPVTE